VEAKLLEHLGIKQLLAVVGGPVEAPGARLGDAFSHRMRGVVALATSPA
jgi:homoserine acetyltransferase